MIGLDRLIERKGVLAAGQFSKDGTVLRAVGDMDKEEMKKVAAICLGHAGSAEKTVKDLDAGTSLEWSSLDGWVVWGGRYALCVSGDVGVIVESSKADFNQLMVDLFGPPAGGKPIY